MEVTIFDYSELANGRTTACKRGITMLPETFFQKKPEEVVSGQAVSSYPVTPVSREDSPGPGSDIDFSDNEEPTFTEMLRGLPKQFFLSSTVPYAQY